MSDSLQYSKLVKSYNCEDFETKRMSGIIEGINKLQEEKYQDYRLSPRLLLKCLAGLVLAS